MPNIARRQLAGNGGSLARKIDIAEARRQFDDHLRNNDLTLRGEGLVVGQKRRCDATNKDGCHGKNDGEYVYYENGWPAGSCVNYTLARGWSKWKYRPEGGVHLNAAERAELYQQTRKARAEASAERARAVERAASIARETWAGTEPIADGSGHEYLRDKGIEPHGIRMFAGEKLAVPMYARVGDQTEIVNLQYIDPDGTKRFIAGGRVAGCYYRIKKAEDDYGQTVCICEGFATGASVREATRYEVFVGFNTGNLLAVARMVAERRPKAKIVICADDDQQTEGNPGLTAANRAARAIGAVVAVPNFGTMARSFEQTDFNDLAREKGHDAVAEAIEDARQPEDAVEELAAADQIDAGATMEKTSATDG